MAQDRFYVSTPENAGAAIKIHDDAINQLS